MSEEINYYILADDLENNFTKESDNRVKYNFDNKSGDFEKISVENILIGCNKNTKTLKYLFIVKEINGNTLTLEKRLSYQIGVEMVDKNLEKMLEYTNLIPLKFS